VDSKQKVTIDLDTHQIGILADSLKQQLQENPEVVDYLSHEFKDSLEKVNQLFLEIVKTVINRSKGE
jgi:hypothetical protein